MNVVEGAVSIPAMIHQTRGEGTGDHNSETSNGLDSHVSKGHIW